MKKRKVGILLFDYVDVLDFTGPAEVLSLIANNKMEQAVTLYKKTYYLQDHFKYSLFLNREQR